MVGLLNFKKLKFEGKDLTGKVSIVTGANIGIGYETAKGLGHLNSKVYLLCRNREKGELAIKKLELETNRKNYHLLTMDLSSFSSIKSAVLQFLEVETRLDILINNAGLVSDDRIITEDGIERELFRAKFIHFNVVTNFKIYTKFEDLYMFGKLDFKDLKGLDSSKHYSLILTYSKSKRYILMFNLELNRRLKASNCDITIATTHPGLVATDIGRKPDLQARLHLNLAIKLASVIEAIYCRTPEKAAITSLHAAVDDKVTITGSGNYWVSCKLRQLPRRVTNPKNSTKLFDRTLEILAFDGSTI